MGREPAHRPHIPVGSVKVRDVSGQPSLYVQSPVHHSPLGRQLPSATPGFRGVHTGGEVYPEKGECEKRPRQSWEMGSWPFGLRIPGSLVPRPCKATLYDVLVIK